MLWSFCQPQSWKMWLALSCALLKCSKLSHFFVSVHLYPGLPFKTLKVSSLAHHSQGSTLFNSLSGYFPIWYLAKVFQFLPISKDLKISYLIDVLHFSYYWCLSISSKLYRLHFYFYEFPTYILSRFLPGWFVGTPCIPWLLTLSITCQIF